MHFNSNGVRRKWFFRFSASSGEQMNSFEFAILSHEQTYNGQLLAWHQQLLEAKWRRKLSRKFRNVVRASEINQSAATLDAGKRWRKTDI